MIEQYEQYKTFMFILCLVYFQESQLKSIFLMCILG